jgi:hypothetical protein
MDAIKSYANVILGFIIVAVISFGYWKISSTISDYKEQVALEKLETKKYLDKYNDSQRDIAIEHANVINLTNKLDIINLKSQELEQSINKKMVELNEWKNKPPEIKYVEKVKNIVLDKGFDSKECEDGLRLMKSISELKYEEL